MEKIKEWIKQVNKKLLIAFFIAILVFLEIYIFSEIVTIFPAIQRLDAQGTVKYERFPSPIHENTIQEEPVVTLIFTGDVIPGRSVNSIMTEQNDFTYPFLETYEFLKDADLTVVNLEAPLVSGCPVTNSGMVFCGNTRFVEGLTLAGVDIASIANNHAGNYGKEGVDETVSVLQNNGIDAVGIDSVVYKEVNGVRFAFLAYNGVSPFLDYVSNINKETVQKEVRKAKENADVVIVLYHFGAEYSPFPVPAGGIAPDDPVEIAHFTIDSGADLVVGNHPHWVQGYEMYKGKMIFYALGNFIFDQMWSRETQTGLVLKTTYRGNNLESYELFPVMIKNYSQPYFLEGSDKEAVLQLINERRVYR